MTIKKYFEKTFLIGHGDGKGPGDLGYKRMKSIYKSVFKWLLDGYIRYYEIGAIPSVKNKLISR
jgi:UDP-2,3-diacylglucosamine hydrolase